MQAKGKPNTSSFARRARNEATFFLQNSSRNAMLSVQRRRHDCGPQHGHSRSDVQWIGHRMDVHGHGDHFRYVHLAECLR